MQLYLYIIIFPIKNNTFSDMFIRAENNLFVYIFELSALNIYIKKTIMVPGDNR